MEFGGKGTQEDINSAPTYPMERSGLRAGARPLWGGYPHPGTRLPSPPPLAHPYPYPGRQLRRHQSWCAARNTTS